MTGLDRLAPQLSDADFYKLWNSVAAIGEVVEQVVEQVVERVGQVPREAMVAPAVALRKGGVDVKAFNPAAKNTPGA